MVPMVYFVILKPENLNFWIHMRIAIVVVADAECGRMAVVAFARKHLDSMSK